MSHAFRVGKGPIQVAHESGQSGTDEQQSFMHLFLAFVPAIKNPKSLGLVKLEDVQTSP
jgi:hypothetical protein